jgi:hypothetical protein
MDYTWCLSANSYKNDDDAAKRVFTQKDCLNELQYLAELVVRHHTTTNFSTLKRILAIFNRVLELECAEEQSVCRFMIKCIRNIKYMPMNDNSENMSYVWKEITTFLKTNLKGSELEMLHYDLY